MTQERIATAFASLVTAAGHSLVTLTAGKSLNQQLSQPGDLDFAVDTPLPSLLTAHGAGLAAMGITPIMLTQYDIGRGDAVWLRDERDGSILHLDILCDPRGAGRLGIPTGPLIDAAGTPAEQPWLTAYLVSKRAWKRQWDRLATLSLDGDPALTAAALREVFGSRAGATAQRLLQQNADAAAWRRARTALRAGRWLRRARRNGGPVRLALLRIRRTVGRMRAPAGFWVHISGQDASEQARHVAAILGAAFPHWMVQHWDSDRRATRLRREAARWRPSLIITWSASDGAPAAADLHIEGGGDPAARIAGAMALRLQGRGSA